MAEPRLYEIAHCNCHNQGLKARPHALNRFVLARKRFIAHFRSPPAVAPPPLGELSHQPLSFLLR
jgi:hypothetical protein